MAPYNTGEPRNRWWGAAAARRPLVGWPAFGAVLSPLPRPAPAPPACGTGRFPLRAACAEPALLHFPAGGGIRGRAGVPCVRSGLRPAPPWANRARRPLGSSPPLPLRPAHPAVRHRRLLRPPPRRPRLRLRQKRMWGRRGIDRCGRHAGAMRSHNCSFHARSAVPAWTRSRAQGLGSGFPIVDAARRLDVRAA